MDLMRKWKNRCAWCRRRIAESEEAWAIGVKARSDVDISYMEGPIVEFQVQDRVVPAIVVREGSPAKRAGHDFLHMTCSARCAEALSTVIQRDIDAFDKVTRLR